MKPETVKAQLAEAKNKLEHNKKLLTIAVASTALNGALFYFETNTDAHGNVMKLVAGVGTLVSGVATVLDGAEVVTVGQSVAALEGAVAQHDLSQEPWELERPESQQAIEQ